jgi:hypothetical protein
MVGNLVSKVIPLSWAREMGSELEKKRTRGYPVPRHKENTVRKTVSLVSLSVPVPCVHVQCVLYRLLPSTPEEISAVRCVPQSPAGSGGHAGHETQAMHTLLLLVVLPSFIEGSTKKTKNGSFTPERTRS